jgi:hypothetical protein
VPHNDYSIVAIAPWISPNCTLEYLASTVASPTNAFIFFLPNNSSAPLPLPNDQQWGLGDGGSWKTSHDYPVYAIPGMEGQLIMQALQNYSGNVTDVPNGRLLVQDIPPSDYVRLWIRIRTGMPCSQSYYCNCKKSKPNHIVDDDSKLPSLWVFLLITLGLLVIIIGSTSLTMHFLQRRRRRALQRRVMNGEIDLEALGIKRLTVPQEILDKMPTYSYRPFTEPAKSTSQDQPLSPESKEQLGLNKEAYLDESEAESSVAPAQVTPKGQPNNITPTTATVAIADNPASQPKDRSTEPLPFSQPTCPICLDDFIPNTTTVRELPCRHIFHPECVDTFLLNNSSLCPMCKHSTLPPGHCPSMITNAMVRRERLIRRMRERRANGNVGTRGRLSNFARNASLSHSGGFTGTTTSGVNVNTLYRDALTDLMTGQAGRRSSRVAGSSVSAPSQAQSRAHRTSHEQIEMVSNPTTTMSSSPSALASQPQQIHQPPSSSMTHPQNPPTSISTSPPPAGVATADATEPTPVTGDGLPLSPTTPTQCPPSPLPGQTRSEWARQRALALLGRRISVVDPDEEERRQRRPWWRRAVGAVWPTANNG